MTNYLQQIRNRVPEIRYRMRDLLIVPRLPGTINGTLAEPGPSTRTVTDTGNNLAITSGKLRIGGAVANGDPGIWWSAQTRRDGLMLIGSMRVDNVLQAMRLGWDSDQAGSLAVNAFRTSANAVQIEDNLTLGPVVFVPVNDTSYGFAVVLRETGAYYFWQDAGTWKLIWASAAGNVATIYPAFSNISVISGSVWNFSVPNQTWLPKPLLSDGFGSANVPSASDYGGVSDGTYTQTGLGGDDRKAFFDGTNSYCDIYSADLNNKLDGAEASIIVRCKLDLATWADGIIRYAVGIRVDGNNRLYLSKPVGANSMYVYYLAGGVGVSLLDATFAGETNWFTWSATFSDNNNQLRVYKNGIESAASPVATAGVWVGDLLNTNCCIGSQNTVPATVWDGWLSDTIVLYSVVATPAQMLAVHTHLDAGTLTEEYLNDTFGIGAWSWWKLNESFISDGLGHAEGIAGGIGAGGDGLRYEQIYGTWDNLANEMHCSFIDPVLGYAIAVADCKTDDVIITVDVTVAGGVAGGTARYTDSDNMLRFWHDGANAVLRERISGATLNIISAAVAYVAGAPLRLSLDGTTARLYYNNTLVGSAVISDGLPESNWHGVYSTAIDNTVDNLTIYARGTDDEYDILSKF